MNIIINPKFKSIVPPLRPEELLQLEASIIADGCRDPLVLWDETLIDGHNRFDICTRNKIPFKTVAIELEDELSVLIWIRQNQVSRRNLSDDMRAVNAFELKKLLSEKAMHERAKTARAAVVERNPVKKNPDMAHTVSAKSDKPKHRTERSAEKAAKTFNVSRRKVEQAQYVSEHSPELSHKVAMGEMPLADAVRDIKKTEMVSNLESIENKKAKEMQGVYDVVVCDPPWEMQKVERDSQPYQTGLDYPVMTEEELADFKIPAADDCHLWLWTTHRFLPMAFRLLEKWGLKYVCTFVWHKNGGFQMFGLPQYNCEFALYARKGSPKFIDTKAFPVCFNAPRGAHSEKPSDFYDVVRRVTAGRRIDIFSRRKIEGFDGYGNEAVE